MTSEFDPTSTYEACAPLHWDVEEWDFQAWSENEESLTDGEDLQFLFNGKLENEDGDDDMSWEGDFSTSEEEVNDASTEEDSAAGGFLHGESSEDNEETDGGISYSSDSGGDDSSDDDSDTSATPQIKHRKVSGTYW
jgi:hypothetical protein